jgi:hypothetical protein
MSGPTRLDTDAEARRLLDRTPPDSDPPLAVPLRLLLKSPPDINASGKT